MEPQNISKALLEAAAALGERAKDASIDDAFQFASAAESLTRAAINAQSYENIERG